ncbi:hypothetical protein LSTR_LSTR014985 [Laodelphax striatellus]|uniref:RNase NYN domain-containing protein n=1 Tax=Laodelphax striatellus TaxID=195883 RepID=A0A482XMP4_LAOST|nr:hypothetical protein LSTR_LSTR014985 [Laodelphax striatellus]
MEKSRQPMLINLIDDSLIVLDDDDDDDDDNDRTSSLVMIDDDDSTVNINDDTLNTTVASPRATMNDDDDRDVITINDDEDDLMVLPNEKQQQPSEKLNNVKKTLENEDIDEIFNRKQPLKSNIDGKSVENEGLNRLTNEKQLKKLSIGGRPVENNKVIEVFSGRQLEKSNVVEKSFGNNDFTELAFKNQPGTSNISEKSVENEEIIEVFNRKQSEKSNIQGKSDGNKDFTNKKRLVECVHGKPIVNWVDIFNKCQSGHSKASEKSVVNKIIVQIMNENQQGKSNIGGKSIENDASNRKQLDSGSRDIVQLIDKNQPGNSNIGGKSVDCVSKTTEVDENSEKGEETVKGKRKRLRKHKVDAKCSSSETGVKKAKLDENERSVLTNTDANLVTDEARSLPETCADKSAVLDGRIGKKKRKGRLRKRKLLEQNRLCEALKSSLQNDASNLAYCFQFLHSPASGLRGLSDGGGRRKKNEEGDKKRSEDGGEKNNGEKEGDKKNTNDADKEKTKNCGANEKKDGSGDKTEDDDVIVITDSASSSQTKPANLSRNNDLDVGWSRPAHFAPKPVPQDLVQNVVKKLSKNKKLKAMKAAATSSSTKTKSCVTESNRAQIPSSYAQVVSNSTQNSSPGSNSGPMLLNVTKNVSQDNVIVIDDGDKVFRPRVEPVASSSNNQLSLVGNNVFVPCSMPPRKGPRPVFIDGCNVAFSHGKNVTFSVKGIEICVDYFRRLGNRVFVVLPNHRKGHLSDATLRAWETDGTLVETPSRRMNHSLVASDDDRYVIQCSSLRLAIIVTKDQYRNHMGINPIWDQTIQKRLLMLTWMQDMLIFPDDPLGRNGPKLKDFLMY